ncbi:hypothetical protein V6N11_032219 [Hibiscus sabdariffa]|uniref:2Fe-2S ferredoxin-type domain-containing protein n=1 Tax=Hibiscus sabdariffa TaxID=183260 RepID=A0ABR2T069_9ROSI
MDEEKESNEPSAVDFAFVHSGLLLDGTPVSGCTFRRACGGQKLRDTMLDNNITLSCMDHIRRPLLNCAGGTCGTCMVEEKCYLQTKDIVSSKPDSIFIECQTISTPISCEREGAARLLGSRTDKEKEKLKMVFYILP